MPNSTAWLAGLGQALSGLGADMTQRRLLARQDDLLASQNQRQDALLAEQRQRQSAQDALNRLVTLSSLGGSELGPGEDPTAALQSLQTTNALQNAPGVPMAGLALPPSTVSGGFGAPRVVKLPNADGSFSNILLDPSRTPQAQSERRFLAQQNATDQRQERQFAATAAAQQRGTVEKQRQAYGTLKAMFPKHPLAAMPFDADSPADYATALAAANAEQHDLRVANVQSQRTGNGNDFKTMNAEAQLRSQYDGDPVVKNAKDMAQSYGKVLAAAANPTPAGDLSLIFSYMKMLDPGSTVREGEFANAQNAGGVPDRIRNAYNRAKSGERLNPEMRADFVAQTKRQADSQRQMLKASMARYSATAARHGLDAQNVVFDPFEVYDGPASGDTKDAKQPQNLTDPSYLDEWLKANPPRRTP